MITFCSSVCLFVCLFVYFYCLHQDDTVALAKPKFLNPYTPAMHLCYIIKEKRLICLLFVNGEQSLKHSVILHCVKEKSRRSLTDKLSKSFEIVVISLPLCRILLLLSTNVVPCEQEVIVVGNRRSSAETVVAPTSRLPYHLRTLLSKRTSNSSSSFKGSLVKTTP